MTPQEQQLIRQRTNWPEKLLKTSLLLKKQRFTSVRNCKHDRLVVGGHYAGQTSIGQITLSAEIHGFVILPDEG